MTDTTQQAVLETPAPDATVIKDNTITDAAPSPAAVDTSDKSEPKSGAQKRIDELTWHRRNLERDRNYWRDLALQQSKPAVKEDKPAETTQLKKLADFEYDEEKYLDYLADRAAERAEKRLNEKTSKERTESSRKEGMAKFREREAAVRAELEDYEDYAYSAPIDDISDVIMAMDEGPRIAYYLGKNPETAARLNSLPPHLAAVELGRLDARLAQEREQAKAKPVSKAPPPPPKIDATEPAVSKDPSEMTDSEFAKWRKRQIAQRR